MGKGIDFWNIETGTVETIVDSMPPEIEYGWSNRRGRVISTSDHTELVFFGGWTGGYVNKVWKYNYPRNSWEFVGRIQYARSTHLAIPVKRMECP
jgi:hypothetical protein